MEDLTDEELAELELRIENPRVGFYWKDRVSRLIAEVRRQRAHKCPTRGPAITATIGKDGLIDFGFEQ